MAMEDLPINNMNGQSYGFVVYRKSVNVTSGSVLLVRNHIRDLAQVIVDGHLQTPPIKSILDLPNFGSWANRLVLLPPYNKIGDFGIVFLVDINRH